MPKPLPASTVAKVTACIIAGTYPSDEKLAIELKVSKGMVSKIRNQIPTEIIGKMDSVKAAELRNKIDDYLGELLDSNIRIARQTTDPDWLRNQRAGELADLQDVQTENMIRVLEAINQNNSAQEEEELHTNLIQGIPKQTFALPEPS